MTAWSERLSVVLTVVTISLKIPIWDDLAPVDLGFCHPHVCRGTQWIVTATETRRNHELAHAQLNHDDPGLRT